MDISRTCIPNSLPRHRYVILWKYYSIKTLERKSKSIRFSLEMAIKLANYELFNILKRFRCLVSSLNTCIIHQRTERWYKYMYIL